MPIPDLLDRLLRAPGPTGHEQQAAAVVREAAAALGAEAEGDLHGSTIVRLGAGAPLLAIVAHVDQVGMAVSDVGADGLLSVHRLAAWSPAFALGQRVRVLVAGGVIPGVVGRRNEAEDKPGWDELYVDVGAVGRDEASALVAEGDPIVLDAPPVELANGRVASCALDNRASVWAALETLRLLAPEPPCALAVLAAVQEEVGSHAGARTGIHRLRPDVAVVLDVTYATDSPEGDPRAAGDHRLGGGPAIFRGPVVHPTLFDTLVDAAEAEDIPFSVETGERTMTDADHVYVEGAGVPTAVVSIPLRRMHTGVETVQLSDLDDTVRLLVGFARRLGPDLDFSR